VLAGAVQAATPPGWAFPFQRPTSAGVGGPSAPAALTERTKLAIMLRIKTQVKHPTSHQTIRQTWDISVSITCVERAHGICAGTTSLLCLCNATATQAVAVPVMCMWHNTNSPCGWHRLRLAAWRAWKRTFVLWMQTCWIAARRLVPGPPQDLDLSPDRTPVLVQHPAESACN
jgi:hypothetical protein